MFCFIYLTVCQRGALGHGGHGHRHRIQLEFPLRQLGGAREKRGPSPALLEGGRPYPTPHARMLGALPTLRGMAVPAVTRSLLSRSVTSGAAAAALLQPHAAMADVEGAVPDDWIWGKFGPRPPNPSPREMAIADHLAIHCIIGASISRLCLVSNR